MATARQYNRWHQCLVLVLLGVMGSPACQEAEPLPPYFTDLGDEHTLLMPPASTWMDVAIKDGQAEWPATGALAAEVSGKRTPSEPPAALNERVEQEIRELISEFNEIVAEKAYGELADYYIPRQRTVLRELLQVTDNYSRKLGVLADVLDEKSPGSGASFRDLLDRMPLGETLILKVETISVQSATSVVATMGSDQVRFLLEDDEWFVESPALEPGHAMLPQLEAGIAQIEALISALEVDQISPDAIGSQLEEISGMLRETAESDGSAAGEE